MPTWSANQYLKFSEERTRPCRDLAARISVSPVRRAIDLGCGPGNSTEVLAALWPHADLTGLDSSANMIEDARRSKPECRWIAGDIAEWANSNQEQYDVVFSNAALQWVHDHGTIFARLMDHLAAGGAFAIQVPGNWDGTAHRLMREVAASPAWREQLAGGRVREWHVHDLDFYYDVLAPRATRVDLWATDYIHILPGVEGIVEWYRGTGMRPFLDALATDDHRERFAADYLERLKTEYVPQPDGRVLFPFRRLFAIAYR